jgi:hypothetical protein
MPKTAPKKPDPFWFLQWTRHLYFFSFFIAPTTTHSSFHKNTCSLLTELSSPSTCMKRFFLLFLFSFFFGFLFSRIFGEKKER